jgi:hypothetical protein
MMIGAIVSVLAIGVCAGLYGWIQWDAHQKADAIWAANPQAENQVDALLMTVQSDTLSMKQRNQAVWVLGRIRAESALGTLQQYYTGVQCNHDNELCQDELKKAIQRCGG